MTSSPQPRVAPIEFQVERANLESTRVIEVEPRVLHDGEARLSVDHFGLTTNNITYGVYGDQLRYWDFFPASGDRTRFGRIPVWGFATVIESRSDAVDVGERLFGYLPLSSELVIEPGHHDGRGVTDFASHRRELPKPYNRYQRIATDPAYEAGREDQQIIMLPLFYTSFLIDDFLEDNADFGATQVIISSISSKTALGVAHLARLRGLSVVGITSPSNVEFVESIGVCDRVLTYDDIHSISNAPSVYVDVAGNTEVLAAVHQAAGGSLTYSMLVGGTHANVAPPVSPTALVGPSPKFLFAPAQVKKRTEQWGRDELDRRHGAAFAQFTRWSDGFLTYVHHEGPDAVTETFDRLLHGSIDPAVADICHL